MKQFITDVVNNHNTISALTKTRSFSFYTRKTLLSLILYTIMYLILVSIFWILFGAPNLDFSYLIILIGVTLITLYVSYNSLQELKLSKSNTMKEVGFMVQRVLLITSIIFTLLITTYYEYDLNIVLIIMNSIVMFVCLTLEILKISNNPYDYNLFATFFLMGSMYYVVSLQFSIVTNTTIGIELLIIASITFIFYIFYFLIRMFQIRSKYVVISGLVFFGLSIAFANHTELQQLESSNYFRLKDITYKEYQTGQIIKHDGMTYTHYYTNNSEDLFVITNDFDEEVNRYKLNTAYNGSRHLYLLDDVVYVYEPYFSPEDNTKGRDRLYVLTEEKIELVYEYEVVHHRSIPFIIDGNYTYFVTSTEAYQIIDGENIPLENLINIDENQTIVETDHFKVFIEDQRYHYYHDVRYQYSYLYDRMPEDIDEFKYSELWINTEGETLSSINNGYEFYKKEILDSEYYECMEEQNTACGSLTNHLIYKDGILISTIVEGKFEYFGDLVNYKEYENFYVVQFNRHFSYHNIRVYSYTNELLYEYTFEDEGRYGEIPTYGQFLVDNMGNTYLYKNPMYDAQDVTLKFEFTDNEDIIDSDSYSGYFNPIFQLLFSISITIVILNKNYN